MAGLDPLSAGLSILQTGFGLFQSISGAAKLKKLVAERTPYARPEEIDKILELAQSRVGGDTQTRDFQTNQIDKSFGNFLGVSQRLGADPNDMSALFDQKINGLLKVGQEFHSSNMQSFANLSNALNLVADNRTAEWRSKEDMLKDRIQAVSGQVQAGYGNIQGGINTGIAAYSASKTSQLYNDPYKVV